jgi:glucose-6-phosphate-specific signal transduction histidine kinase
MNEHLGLIGMRERVEMLGGSFSITSSPSRGTSIFAEIPSPMGRIKLPTVKKFPALLH